MRRDETALPAPPADDFPDDPWQCGPACDGSGVRGCPRGPGRWGRCGAPGHPCVPVRTYRGRKRLIVSATVLAGVAVLVALTVFKPRSFYKPGPLARPHALILSQTADAQSCAACHPAASTSLSGWFRSAGADHAGITQSDRCMDCHHVRLPARWATSPHNLSRQRLEAIRLAWSADGAAMGKAAVRNVSSAGQSIQCAACHREHGGADADLSQLSSAQCQSCHSRTFKSFGDGHPQWHAWPYRGTAAIAFDHASHASRHFPKAKDANGSMERRFDCGVCHPRSDSGQPLMSVDYPSACADCHDGPLHTRAGQQLDLFALPSLGEDAAMQAAPWPPAAVGFFDGDISPLTRWLISGDPKVAAALARLPQDGNITSIDPQRADQRQAATEIAIAIRIALDELATEGVASAVVDRSEGHPGMHPERAAASMRQLLSGVSPQLIWDARLRWFAAPPVIASRPRLGVNRSAERAYDRNPAVERSAPLVPPMARVAQAAAITDALLGGDVLLGGDDLLSGEDPLRGDPLELDERSPRVGEPGTPSARVPVVDRTMSERFDPARMLPRGGWYRDDLRMAIAYRAGGHADPVLKAAVELAAGLAENDLIRRDLLRTGPVAACVECHTGALNPAGPVWKNVMNSQPAGSQRIGFHAAESQGTKSLTRFSHTPHFNLPQLADCTHCHRVDDHGFAPLKKELCASCHHRSAAGDACTQCHRYHAGP